MKYGMLPFDHLYLSTSVFPVGGCSFVQVDQALCVCRQQILKLCHFNYSVLISTNNLYSVSIILLIEVVLVSYCLVSCYLICSFYVVEA